MADLSSAVRQISAARRRRKKRARAARTQAGERRGGIGAGRKIGVAAVCALSALLQNSLMQHVSFLGVRPSLPLVATIAAGLSLGVMPGGVAGFLLGLYQDAQTGKILGLYALLCLYAGIAGGLVSQRARQVARSLPLSAAFAGILAAAYEICLYLFAYAIPVLRGGYRFSAGAWYAIGRVIIPSALLNAAAFVPYYFLMGARRAPESPAGSEGALTREPE
ncbi:MAG: rod shape-determining protein MreD [Clostridiales bacterium]|jgi:rod shape-determining protein MreD|nr:rod shape-determining protein MreD [Clostridiales bacterium]